MHAVAFFHEILPILDDITRKHLTKRWSWSWYLLRSFLLSAGPAAWSWCGKLFFKWDWGVFTLKIDSLQAPFSSTTDFTLQFSRWNMRIIGSINIEFRFRNTPWYGFCIKKCEEIFPWSAPIKYRKSTGPSEYLRKGFGLVSTWKLTNELFSLPTWVGWLYWGRLIPT